MGLDIYFHKTTILQDVKDCLTQMKKYRKLLKEGVVGYAVFSW